MGRRVDRDLTGQKFGRWTVLYEDTPVVRKDNRMRHMWMCKCECGTIKSVSEQSLIQGRSKSCGCYHSEIMVDVSKKANTTHGMTDTRLYRIWRHMLNRCYNPNDTRYDIYGGRGITVCDSWHKFEDFASWAFESGYDDSLSIDRISVDDGYTPDNCRWADAIVQSNNRRTCKYYTINNETHNITEWANIYGRPYQLVWKRLKRGWDIETALTK